MNAPQTLGPYRIVREIGRGAMGVVYQAVDGQGREVAIKTLALSDEGDPQQFEARFRQEAKAGQDLQHPNVIAIYGSGREGGLLYIAMELLRGVELRALMTSQALPLPLAVHLWAQVAAGVAAAHAFGIVHRDIKPSNVMVLPGNVAKILDFGVARMESSDFKTRTGVMLGSPKYMSPEQVEGRPADHRSDIFSLGSVLYEMVTGAPPFDGPDLMGLLVDIARSMPVPPSHRNPAVPPALDQIIARALVKDPAWRYQEARQMAKDLARCARTLGAAELPPLAMPPADGSAPTQPAAGDSAGVEPAWEATVVTPVVAAEPVAPPAPPVGSWDQTVPGMAKAKAPPGGS